MENINIKNRVCVLIGPTTSGKTTLAHRIQKEFEGKSVIVSHDEVLKEIPKNQSQYDINTQFRIALLNSIEKAYFDESNDLIILDTLNIQNKSYLSFVLLNKLFLDYEGDFTVLKVATLPEIRKKFLIKRLAKNKNDVDIHSFHEQDNLFRGKGGSLNFLIPGTEEYIVTNPMEIQISFDGLLPGKKYTK